MMSTISKWNCTCINSWKQLWSSTNFYWTSKSWSLYCILPYFGIHIATSICMYVYIYMNVYAYVHMHMCIHMWIYVKTCLRVLLLNMGVLHWECCMMYGKQSAVKYGNKLDLIWFRLIEFWDGGSPGPQEAHSLLVSHSIGDIFVILLTESRFSKIVITSTFHTWLQRITRQIICISNWGLSIDLQHQYTQRKIWIWNKVYAYF